MILSVYITLHFPQTVFGLVRLYVRILKRVFILKHVILALPRILPFFFFFCFGFFALVWHHNVVAIRCSCEMRAGWGQGTGVQGEGSLAPAEWCCLQRRRAHRNFLCASLSVGWQHFSASLIAMRDTKEGTRQEKTLGT